MTSNPDLGKIVADLKSRDVDAIGKRLTDAERATKPQTPRRKDSMKVFSADERRVPGVSTDQGFVDTGFKPKPNLVAGVNTLRMKEKPRDWRR